ncbi:MAG: hypothetical protein AAFZ65_08860, partial [Planctomycetota bacterium]
MSCASRAPERAEPPQPAAIDAFGRASALERALSIEGRADRDALRALYDEAASADPNWIPPQRELDELARAALEGHLAWDRRRAAVARDDATAADLYLLGRLELAAGVDAFYAAVARDPRTAWAHHALSVDAELRGDLAGAIESERRAAAYARTGLERIEFGRRLFALLARDDREGEADDLLRGWVDDLEDEVPPEALMPLRLEWVERDLRSDDGLRQERGRRAALEILGTQRLADRELQSLLAAFDALTDGRSRAALDAELERSLDRGPGSPSLERPARLGRRPSQLRFDLVFEGYEPSTAPRALAGRELAQGRPAQAARAWLAEQPTVVLADDGLPRDRRLRTWVEIALEHEQTSLEVDRALAAALLDAGWQDLASSPIERLIEAAREGRSEPEPVLALHRRELAIEAIDAELDLLIAALFDGRRSIALTPPTEPGRYADAPSSSKELLVALQRVFREHGPHAGLSADVIESFEQSPRLAFGPFASVVIPNPRFGPRDVLYGTGRVGEPVPGLAAAFDELGRFGLFGAGVGRPPDGTVLRRLWVEQRSGTHLGRPWQGTLAWCDGADSDGARSRAAGQVSGAALHEGYWIDVQVERERLERFERLTERHLAGGERPAVLDLPAPRVPDGLDGNRLRAERRRLVPPMRQGDRVALALLYERSLNDASEAPSVSLDDLLEVVQVHEEGHLCDRSRYLPLGRNLLGLIGLGLGEWLAGDLGFERRVEYRAQAVALASVSEPRLALMEILDAAEVDTRVLTVHARAYRKLLEDFLVALDAALADDPAGFPTLDPRAYLVHQLHLLGPEQVRRVAVAVADDEGLVADGWS